jgi:hypothetical protein
MAITYIPKQQGVNAFGLLERVMAMKQREKEFKAEQKWREDVEKPYREAQARYMESMADNMMTNELREQELALKNEQLAIPKEQLKMEKERIANIRRAMVSFDKDTRDLARNTFWGVKSNVAMGDQIDSLRLQLQMTQAQHGAMMDAAKLKIDQQNSLLTGFKFATEFGPILEKEIGKDAFKAGYEAMSETLGFKASGGGETKSVGTPKASTVPSPWGTPMGATAAPQMSLEQALEAYKTGSVSGEDLIAAWPSLEGVLAPGGASAPTTNGTSGSFEQNLIKRLQQ